MRTIRVFCDHPLPPGATIDLGQDIANYMGRVLRLKPQDQIVLFNGQGFDMEATILSIERKSISLQLGRPLPISSESPLNVTLGQVVSRGDRMDYAVQKATELGVTSVAPLTSERCEVRLDDDRREKRRQHWQQVIISACEQSGRVLIPEVAPIQSLQQWLESANADLKLILHPYAGSDQANGIWSDDSKPPGSVLLLVGPEGGFNDLEVSLAEQAGFKRLSLGPRILRTETAPVAALSYLQYLWGDFQNSLGPL